MIECEVTKVGEDDSILVVGGTRHHIGAVVIATWEDHYVKVVSHGLPHHKEEELFIELAKVWCETFKRTTMITGGIHIDHATKEEIKMLVDETWRKFFILMSDQKIQSISNL
ncbi:hypothetical protein LGQ02_14170 [Bacillus shivajii]|uniref:prenylated flavin chaperone LpdD n=1 Tax=Bacillus shivajii TaxID=1983719 RepID=UPI001CFAAFD8|nr:hypothetical protein [Bacillus shivajii]UCZ51991.1 hypothetical protein LGQ02_14170 [Bacillus shivajii]